GGSHLAARFLSSPRYLKWLTEAPMQGGTPRGMEKHLNRLSAIASEDSEIGPDILKVLKDFTPGAQAQAPTPPYNDVEPEKYGKLRQPSDSRLREVPVPAIPPGFKFDDERIEGNPDERFRDEEQPEPSRTPRFRSEDEVKAEPIIFGGRRAQVRPPAFD